MNEVFEHLSPGQGDVVGLPEYGRQHQGITPGGAMDQFSYQCGQILLGYEHFTPSLEFIFPLRLPVPEDVSLVLTGAQRPGVIHLSTGSTEPFPHAEVVNVPAGSELEFATASRGLRSYLGWRPMSEKLAGRSRGSWEAVAHYEDPDRRIRVIPGPEYDRLESPALLFEPGWETTQELSRMGVRIAHPKVSLRVTSSDIISDVVANGTVQCTPTGPVILLRHRQTIGGYPRVFQVISADVDQLAQLGPQCPIQFTEITQADAVKILRQRKADLESFKRRFPPVRL